MIRVIRVKALALLAAHVYTNYYFISVCSDLGLYTCRSLYFLCTVLRMQDILVQNNSRREQELYILRTVQNDDWVTFSQSSAYWNLSYCLKFQRFLIRHSLATKVAVNPTRLHPPCRSSDTRLCDGAMPCPFNLRSLHILYCHSITLSLLRDF